MTVQGRNGERLGILLVDDQPEGLVALEAILGDLGQDIVKAGSGKEALRQVLMHDFAVILLDIQMPEMDGFDTAALIRARPRNRHTPVIFLTAAYHTETARMHGYEVGAVDFLYKPVDPFMLRAKVSVFLDLAREREQVRAQAEEIKALNATLERRVAERTEELVRANEQLRHSEERFQLAFRATNEALWDWNLGSGTVIWGEAMERLFGWTQEDAAAGEWYARIHPEDQEEAATTICQAASGGAPAWEAEHRFRRKDGSYAHVANRASVLYDTAGKATRMVGAMADVTARKAAEEELQAVSQQLWQSAKLASVGELAASIAHELNNPLATVSLRVEQLLTQPALDDRARRALEVVEQETERMAKLVAGLLEMGRRGTHDLSAVDVAAEIDSTVELIEHYFTKRDVETVLDLPPGLPTVPADRQKIRQLFLNLFTNAADAMPGGGTITVRAHVEEAAPTAPPALVVEVADTGVGIAAENLPRLGEAFFTTKPEGKGTGLGISICRRVVKEHGGSMEYASKPGAGTTVRIVLPVGGPESTPPGVLL